jgi:hypothetical protein
MTVESDESYVIGICDLVLDRTAQRQHRFHFLRGDPSKNGNCAKLPVDAYYPELSLVVEYWERQHTELTPIMDKRMTCSGCNRGEQRRRYDQRKKEVLREHEITLVVLGYEMFECNGQKRLRRNSVKDKAVICETINSFLSQRSDISLSDDSQGV